MTGSTESAWMASLSVTWSIESLLTASDGHREFRSGLRGLGKCHCFRGSVYARDKMAAAITGSTEDKGKNSGLKSAGTTGLGSAGSWAA